MGPVGVIAGTGFYDIPELADVRTRDVMTTYGPVAVTEGSLHGRPVVFISRHGYDHSVPPHMVNYRAIMQAMADLNVEGIFAINVVGGIGHEAGELVIVDDFIDYTKNRTVTFFDGSTPEGVVHIDMGEPYNSHLREVWRQACIENNSPVTFSGVYGAFEGPRFETKAEIRMAQSDGVTVVGMTGVPEVVLAAERGIPYASLCLVANPAAGLGTEPITVEDVNAVVANGAAQVKRILSSAIRAMSEAS